MTTSTLKIKTLKSFIAASSISPALITAVVDQIGGWEAFCESAEDIANNGINGGFHGFIYYTDTEAFAKRNRAAIAMLAEAQADDFGMEVSAMIAGFRCFRGQKITSSEVGRALYAGENMPDGVNMLNALAWYAGEEVARSFSGLNE